MSLLPHMFFAAAHVYHICFLLPHMYTTYVFAAAHIHRTCWAVEIRAVMIRADEIWAVVIRADEILAVIHFSQKIKTAQKTGYLIRAVSFFVSSSWLFQKIVDQLRVELLQFELLNPFYKEAPKSSWYFVSFCRIALTYCQNPTTFLLAESFAAPTLIRFLVDVFHICNPSSRTNCKLHLSELSYWLTLFKLTVCCFHHVILSYILSDNLHLWRTINYIVNCSIGGGLVSMFIIKLVIGKFRFRFRFRPKFRFRYVFWFRFRFTSLFRFWPKFRFENEPKTEIFAAKILNLFWVLKSKDKIFFCRTSKCTKPS